MAQHRGEVGSLRKENPTVLTTSAELRERTAGTGSAGEGGGRSPGSGRSGGRASSGTRRHVGKGQGGNAAESDALSWEPEARSSIGEKIAR